MRAASTIWMRLGWGGINKHYESPFFFYLMYCNGSLLYVYNLVKNYTFHPHHKGYFVFFHLDLKLSSKKELSWVFPLVQQQQSIWQRMTRLTPGEGGGMFLAVWIEVGGTCENLVRLLPPRQPADWWLPSCVIISSSLCRGIHLSLLQLQKMAHVAKRKRMMGE